MKILVTGGAGFIGSHVVSAYLAAGHKVVVVDDLSHGKKENVPPYIQFHKLDIRDKTQLRLLFQQENFDVVNHQAALANVRESMVRPDVYAEVNIIGSINLLEAAKESGVKRFIYASTGGAVYGEPVYLPATEEHPINPLDPYGASKHAVEHYLYLYHANYGLDYVVLRYPNVYGPRQDPFGEAGVVAIFTQRMLQGKKVTINGDGTQQRDFLYVGDVAKANTLALTRGDNGIYNLGTGIPVDVNTIYRKLKELAGYSLDANYGPPKKGEVYRIYLDATKARSTLGWEPTVSLDNGLRMTVDYFKEHPAA